MSIFQIISDVFFVLLIAGFTGWALFRLLKRSDNAVRLGCKWIFTALLLALMYFVLVPQFKEGGGAAVTALGLTGVWGLVMTILWRNSLIDLVANPISSLYDGGRQQIEPVPYYSIAISKRKSNHPLEAIVEIRQQLAKFPHDFEGVTLLAGIQAEDLKDLPAAESTLDHFCERPDAPPAQVAAVLTQLADWHLKIAADADYARVMLEKIIARFPGTSLALQAGQRIARLGGTEKILLAAQNRQPMLVPEGVNNIGLLDSTEFLQPQEIDPEKLAAEYVKHLDEFPQDAEAREKLAVIYARHYQRLDLAAAQLMQLADQPGQPPKRAAHWLNLLADLQVQGGADYETVRATLEKIVERFPKLPAGEIAASRLGRLKLEIKGMLETPTKKLGVYEQNIGLKYGSPRPP